MRLSAAVSRIFIITYGNKSRTILLRSVHCNANLEPLWSNYGGLGAWGYRPHVYVGGEIINQRASREYLCWFIYSSMWRGERAGAGAGRDESDCLLQMRRNKDLVLTWNLAWIKRTLSQMAHVLAMRKLCSLEMLLWKLLRHWHLLLPRKRSHTSQVIVHRDPVRHCDTFLRLNSTSLLLRV